MYLLTIMQPHYPSPAKLASGCLVTASTLLAMLQAHAKNKLQHVWGCCDLPQAICTCIAQEHWMMTVPLSWGMQL